MLSVLFKIITDRKYCGKKCPFLKKTAEGKVNQWCRLFREAMWHECSLDKYIRLDQCKYLVKTRRGVVKIITQAGK